MPLAESPPEVPSCLVPDQLATVGAGAEGAGVVVPPPPESVVVCSPYNIAQPKERVAVMMIASKIFITVPLFAELDYLARFCLWNKV